MTHLHFYFHEMYSGPNATGLVVAVPPALIVIDDMLREGPERSSKLIGRAQGLSAQASLDGTALLTAINFVFTEGEYNGSTVVILGKCNRFLLIIIEFY
ncbi:disease resistance response protein 206 [Musa troglodytarum]|uniref:Dirigent protein n=1 Tax=Musa troglodytarum TaxID=320322 RepID=A0A9E7KX80_9LILI|nr:disease resistance response protein 206 [Musa troglodytarum]